MIYLLQSLRGKKSYTDFILYLIIISKYYNDYNKIIYASRDTYNLLENKKCLFHNIEENNAFKLLNHILPSKFDRHNLDTKQLFAERVTKNNNINDLYANGFISGVDNFLIDNEIESFYNRYYKNNR